MLPSGHHDRWRFLYVLSNLLFSLLLPSESFTHSTAFMSSCWYQCLNLYSIFFCCFSTINQTLFIMIYLNFSTSVTRELFRDFQRNVGSTDPCWIWIWVVDLQPLIWLTRSCLLICIQPLVWLSRSCLLNRHWLIF